MSRYLQHIRIARYGGLADRAIGPLSPGMNVVYGQNEAGKSTLSSFIGGVLFGWEDAHGVRNTYRPSDGGDRSGELVWRSREGDSVYALSRDEAGVFGDQGLVEDIDEATYRAIFSLSSDELRSLRDSTDVMARLLAASSGAGSSPAGAFVEIEQRIAALTAPADQQGARAGDDGRQPCSVFQIEKQLEAKREQLKEASARTALLVQEDRELRELKSSRASTIQRIDALNDEVEDLVAWRAELGSIDARIAEHTDALGKLAEEREELLASASDGCSFDRRLLALDSSADQALRDKLDELAEERDKLERIVDTAKENNATSTAAYEALCELDEEEVAESRRLRNRTTQALVSVLLPLAFIAAGVPLFLHGRDINSLSISALGIGLVVAAVFLAAAAFFVLFRQPKAADALESRRKDAQWIMLQDRKKLDSSLAAQAAFEGRMQSFFDEVGLAAAEGSIRRARSLLDEARAARMRRTDQDQRISSIDLRMKVARKEVESLRASREGIADAAGLPGFPLAAPRADMVSDALEDTALVPASSLARELDALARAKGAQRDELLEAADAMGQRFGELTRELELARSDRSLDELKFDYQQIRTRLREAKSELIVLFLAKRMLERSIAEWEHRGQPEVYDEAGRLLSLITNGAWVGVSTSPTGSLVAVSSDGTMRDPRHLSLGTCQQLYLSLRLALLATAEDVGRSVPVLADDILVNFDSSRRKGAARALAQLARRRQVVVFTCHRGTVEALCEAAPDTTCVNLSTAGD